MLEKHLICMLLLFMYEFTECYIMMFTFADPHCHRGYFMCNDFFKRKEDHVKCFLYNYHTLQYNYFEAHFHCIEDDFIGH